ncbi:hypothetical protein ERO13_A03G076600v2 [Gossypium hirsutum]|uniref:Protein DCL homolog, chloroplastic isoform X1 n=3 Tax=Gossypium TaxID=3633 RepID=A0A1U8L610_GOSHI|nr:protein DCL homolog, chloroplastic-like isoform X1 [Gossypium hirsutum]KAG4207664.1 hypothetical protein ERO13_A03G076600v2 [Gossypium hirsutum]TYI35840.1 hypothetical protein ES332_A03G103500v1 [Gossypium tomentosum]
MASFLKPSPSNFHLTFIPISFSSSSVILSSPLYQTTSLRVRFCALTTDPDGGRTASQESSGADLLRKPSIVPDEESGGISEEEDGSKEKGNRGEWIDWEDRILRDTVPLVGFVRMILHSGKYGSGDRLSPEHEKSILERLLPYHPESEKKIGCGIDYITSCSKTEGVKGQAFRNAGESPLPSRRSCCLVGFQFRLEIFGRFGVCTDGNIPHSTPIAVLFPLLSC